jgi:hypothetical protein
MPENEKQLSKEDRERLVVTPGVYDQAMEVEALDKRLGDLREDLLDLNGQMLVLQARANKLMGERDEIRANFWNTIRGDYRPWFREMSEAGLTVTYLRTREPETDAEAIMLRAVNLQEEAIRQIFRNFDMGGNNGPNRQ